MIVNKYKNGGGGSGSGVTPQEVQRQIDSALTPYWDSAVTESAITLSVSGKADAANVQTYGDSRYFPKWNEQGVITDKIGSVLYETTFPINNEPIRATIIRAGWNIPLPHIYAPTTSGNAGEVLVSLGDGGAPVWSAVTGPDMSGFYTSAQTDEVIAQAVSGLATEQYVQDALSGVNLENYWTSAETQDAISAATSGKADAANITPNTDMFIFPKWNSQGIISGISQQVFSNYLKVNDGDSMKFYSSSNRYGSVEKALNLYTPLSAGTAGEVLVSVGSGAPVWSAVTMPEVKTVIDFDKTPQAERASIYAELKALYDGGSGATINKNYDFYKTVNTWQGQKIDYYTFSGGSLVFGQVVSPENITDQVVYAQVMTIDAAGNVNVVTNTVGGGGGGDMSNYWNSAETKTYVDSAATNLQDQIDTMDEVIADALNDLNGQLVTKVSSSSVSTIWKGTQAEYDLIVSKDPYTFYIIVSSN